ncbi:hypothetical protein ACMYR3_10180 [Ampullimonas aquatilis]|uniref:hypothetical protein n=1 Tax=Ampullimonas aquatilis TaxID=1341549 RepID=UPI003C7925FD
METGALLTEGEKSGFIRWTLRILNISWIVLLIVAVFLVMRFFKGSEHASNTRPRQYTKMTLEPDLPHPLPKLIEQPKKETTSALSPSPVSALEVPQLKSSNPTPNDARQLRMEGEAGTDVGDIATGTISQEYGTQILGLNNAGSGGRMQWDLYVNRLQRQLQERLGKQTELRSSNYGCMVRVWLSTDGSMERIEVSTTDVNSRNEGVVTKSTDHCNDLELTLRKLMRVAETPPLGLPQPVVMRITNLTSSTP